MVDVCCGECAESRSDENFRVLTPSLGVFHVAVS